MATTKVTPAPLTRPLSVIVREIADEHFARGKTVYFGAAPYMRALAVMRTTNLSATYGEDDADTMVLYLLSNLSTWRGETAKRVKAELQAARAHHAIATHAARD